VVKDIGQGGCATLHLGECLKTGKPCAIKSIFKDSKVERELAFLEAHALSKLNHPLTNRLLEVVEDQFNVYLILDFIEGKDLMDTLLEVGCMSEQDAAHVIRQVVEALEHCHQQGVVHRDVKPENIMMQRTDATQSPKAILVDFGLATAEGEFLDAGMEGTPHYMAPEAKGGPISCRASLDMWSIGIVLYALLTGELLCSTAPDLNEESFAPVSEGARSLLLGLLHPDPCKRLSAEEALRHPWLL